MFYYCGRFFYLFYIYKKIKTLTSSLTIFLWSWPTFKQVLKSLLDSTMMGLPRAKKQEVSLNFTK